MRTLLRTFWTLLALTCINTSAADKSDFQVSEFTFTRPAAWKWVDITPGMRKAQLKIEDEKNKHVGEVVFFEFGPGGGGGVQANVDRWFSQFQEGKENIKAKSEKIKAGEVPITYVQAEGTYLSGMPGGPKTPLPNHRLLGAIVESQQGNVFIRLTAPIPLAQTAEADFKKMVEAAAKRKK